jgi:predicted Zn-dependent protease
MHSHLRRGRLHAIAVLGAVLTGCATDRQVIQQAEDTHAQLKPAVMMDSKLIDYFQEMGGRIVTAAKELDQEHYGPSSHFDSSESNDWMFTKEEFHLVNSKTLNAFTTGGEHMYIYAELMTQCETEDELAAVMAHEYGHVYARHVHKGMNRQFIGLGAAVAGAGIGYAVGGKDNRAEGAAIGGTLGLVGGQFLEMGYTRADEAQADELGFMFYTRAGWDPAHFGDFFQRMIDLGYDKTPEYMSDHPTLASRVAAAKKRVSELPPGASKWREPPIANAAQFAALKQRAIEVGKQMPTDEQLENAQTLLSAVPSCLLPVDQPDQKAAREKIKKAVAAEQAAGAAPAQ